MSNVESLRRIFSSHAHSVVGNYVYIVLIYTRVIMESVTSVVILVVYKSSSR